MRCLVEQSIERYRRLATLLFFLLMTSGYIYLRRYVLLTYHLYMHYLTYVWTYFVSDRR